MTNTTTTPTYNDAILASNPTWGDMFTTTDGVRLEWVRDMADDSEGYCQVDDDTPTPSASGEGREQGDVHEDTPRTYSTPAKWYARLDEVVAEIGDKLGDVEPLATNYESGGHVAYAVWDLPDIQPAGGLLSVILAGEIDECEFNYQPFVPGGTTGWNLAENRPETPAERDASDAAWRAAVVADGGIVAPHVPRDA